MGLVTIKLMIKFIIKTDPEKSLSWVLLNTGLDGPDSIYVLCLSGKVKVHFNMETTVENLMTYVM